MMDARLADRIERAIAAAHQAGKLKWFNRAFAEHRQRNGNLTYRQARARLRKAILRRVMRHQPWNQRTLIAEIFGERRGDVSAPMRKNESGLASCHPTDKTHPRPKEPP